MVSLYLVYFVIVTFKIIAQVFLPHVMYENVNIMFIEIRFASLCILMMIF